MFNKTETLQDISFDDPRIEFYEEVGFIDDADANAYSWYQSNYGGNCSYNSGGGAGCSYGGSNNNQNYTWYENNPYYSGTCTYYGSSSKCS